MATSRICSIEDCGKPAATRGLCSKHYHRLQRHGDPLAGGTTRGEPATYLATVVLPYTGGECLIWPYSRMKNGYANHTHEGRTVVLSRLVCSLVHGAPPTRGHEAAHSCGNGHLGCVNPQHLCWKSHAENEADKLIHGTRLRGERTSWAKLTESAVREIRSLKGVMPQTEIASRFGVSKGAVNDIHRRRNWQWVI